VVLRASGREAEGRGTGPGSSGPCEEERSRPSTCGAGQEMSWVEAGKQERGERRGGWADQQARPVPGVGLKRKEGIFFQFKFFSISSFQF